MGRLGIIVMCLLTIAACLPRFIRLEGSHHDRCLKIIQAHNRQIEQIKATVEVQGRGLFGQFFHERADLVVKSPDNLLWSMRSFFETPAFMVASNGENLTIYDFSRGSLSYEKHAISKYAHFDMFDWPFHPDSLIHLLLGQFPIAASGLSLAGSQNSVRINGQAKNGWQVEAVFDQELGVITAMHWENPQLRLGFKANYKDFRKIDGHLFAHLMVVDATNASSSMSFALSYNHLEINGAVVDSSTFFLPAP